MQGAGTNVSFVLASSHLLIASARHYGRQMGRPVGSARHQSLIWPLVTLAMLPPVGFLYWNLVASSVNPLLSSASTLAWSLVFSVLLQTCNHTSYFVLTSSSKTKLLTLNYCIVHIAAMRAVEWDGMNDGLDQWVG